MANEFDRQEKVSDYDNFVSKKDSQINFNEEFQKINTTVKGIAVGRETKKAKLQSDTDSVISELEKAQKNSNQTLGQTVLKQAANAKKVLLQQNKLLKAGYISPSEYMQILQTAKDDMANWGIANKMWSTEYDLSQTRQQTGKDGRKIASAVETNMNNAATGFNNLNDVEPFTSPSGASFMVKMVIDKETGERTMPSYDDKPENYLPLSSINNLMLYRDDSAKYNVGALVKSKTDLIGSFVTAVVGKYDTLEGGGIVLTEEGARKMDVFLNTDDGKSAFDELKKDTVNLILNDNLSIANVLAQQTGSDPKKKYILAGSKQEFVDAGGTDISKWIKIDRTSVPPSFPDISDAQRKAAEDIVGREFRTQIGASSKQSNLKAGQQINPANLKKTEELMSMGGTAKQIVDALTGDGANAQALMQTLINDTNSRLLAANPAALGKITNFRFTDDQIILIRQGADNISINRGAQSATDVNKDGKIDSDDRDGVDLINQVNSLYQALTGNKATNPTDMQNALKAIDVDTSKLKARAGELTGSITKTNLKNNYNDTSKVTGDKTLIKLVEDSLGEVNGFWSLTSDETERDDLAKIFRDAMSKPLKDALAENFRDETTDIDLITDSDADETVKNYMKLKFPSLVFSESDSEKVRKEKQKEFDAETRKLFPNRALGDEVILIRIAGRDEIIQLDKEADSGQVTNEVARILNQAANNVNDKKNRANKNYTVLEIIKLTPQKTDETTASYKRRVKALYANQDKIKI